MIVQTVKARANYKSINLRKIGISDVVTASEYSEKTRVKKLIMIIIIIFMNESQETTIFTGARN